MYHFVQYKPNKKETWHLVDAKQPLEMPPAFRTVLGVSANPDSFIEQGIDPIDHVKYLGPMYFDLDGKDIDAVLNEARGLLDELDTWGITLEHTSIYLSGKKGIHITIPSKMFGVTGALLHLPLVWGKFAGKFKGEFIDRGVYSAGKGRMWRCSGVKRPDTGTYKVQVTLEEIRAMDSVKYAELVASPRPDFSDNHQIYAVPQLESEVKALRVLVRDEIAAMKKASSNITNEDLQAIEGVPGCIYKLITEGDGPQSNWNQAAMQLAGYIGGKYEKNDEEYDTELVQPFLENVESSSRDLKERKRSMRDLLHRAFNGRVKFSLGGVISVIGKTCGNCELCSKKENKENQVEDGEYLDHRNNIKLTKNKVIVVGEKSNKEIATFGIKQTVNFLERDSFGQMRAVSGYYELTSQQSEIFKIELPENVFNDRRSIHPYLTGTGALFTGTDSELQALGSTIFSLRKEVEEMIRTKSSGIIFHEKEGEIYPQLITKDHCFAKGGVPSKYTYIGSEKLAPEVGNVEDFKTQEEVTEASVALRSLLNMNDLDVILPAIGWTMACMLKAHITHGQDPTFPMLSLNGTSESGKSSTMFLLLALNGFPYRRAPFWNAEVDTMYPLEDMVSSTSTFIRMVDEANEHNAKRNWHRLIGILKSSWDGGDIMKGGLAGRGIATTYVPNTAPIAYLSEQSFPIQSIRTRSIECNFTSRAMSNKDYQHNFKQAENRHKYIEMMAKVFATTALNLPISRVHKWLEDALELLPEKYTGRTRRAYSIVLTGLKFLTYVMETYDKELAKDIEQMQVKYLGVIEESSEDLVKAKRQSALDEILQAFDAMAAEKEDQKHGLEVGVHYWVKGDTLSIDLKQIFPRFRRYARGIDMEVSVRSAAQIKTLIQGELYFEGTTLHPYKPQVEIILLNLKSLRAKGTVLTNFEFGDARNDK